MQQMRDEREEAKQKEESEKKIKQADKKILGAAREPFEDDEYCTLIGWQGTIGWMNLVLTPMTGWSIKNAFFDGLKYCG